MARVADRHEARGRAGASPSRVRGWFVADAPDFRHRGTWLALAFAAMAATLCARLVDVQVLQHATLAARAAALHQKSVTIPATRGRILDSSGRVLVSNRTVYDVYADPGLIAGANRADVASQLAPVLSLDATTVVSLISEPTRFVYLAKAVSQQVSDRLTALTLPGVVVVPAEQRVYEPSPVPGTSFAANLLGYVDADGTGQYGLEAYYDSVLRGTDGHQSTVRDVTGNSITLSNDPQSDAHNGQDLQLGLDSEVQYWAEQAIAQGVATAQAASGTLIMMDTKTGVIRAWAQAPTYNANSYWTSPIADFRDLAVANVYEPGSVQKVVTFAGGLNAHAITPGYTFNEGPTTIDGATIRDWDGRAHGTISMQKVLDESLNNGAIKVGQLMGANAFYSNMLAFGIGAPTGVDLSGEQNAPLQPQSSMEQSRPCRSRLRAACPGHPDRDAGRHQRGRQRRCVGATARCAGGHRSHHGQVRRGGAGHATCHLRRRRGHPRPDDDRRRRRSRGRGFAGADPRVQG